ncbi:MAG TPA: hypothetical protein EYP04_05470, partial [Anaerolineae bacterium]|nr:hypothetical protein [Anaerolineae bacterium]
MTPLGEIPERVERPEGPPSGDRLEIARRIEEAEEFKPEQLRETLEVPLPEVRGFERSGLMTNREVGDYLSETFPPEHVGPESLKRVEYVDMYVPHKDGNVLGMTDYSFFTDTSKIEIYRQESDGSVDRAEMKRTIAHEVGHSAWNDMGWHELSPRQQTWAELSANSAPEEYVSEYAKTNVQEDFAESYATYIHDPELLREVSPDKYD